MKISTHKEMSLFCARVNFCGHPIMYGWGASIPCALFSMCKKDGGHMAKLWTRYGYDLTKQGSDRDEFFLHK